MNVSSGSKLLFFTWIGEWDFDTRTLSSSDTFLWNIRYGVSCVVRFSVFFFSLLTRTFRHMIICKVVFWLYSALLSIGGRCEVKRCWLYFKHRMHIVMKTFIKLTTTQHSTDDMPPCWMSTFSIHTQNKSNYGKIWNHSLLEIHRLPRVVGRLDTTDTFKISTIMNTKYRGLWSTSSNGNKTISQMTY